MGVLAGSANAEHLLQNAPGVKLLSYAEHDRLVEAYLAGEFEILSVTRNVVDEVNARRPPRPLVEHFRQMEFEVAVGMPRGEKALRDWINAWIVVRLRDHTLAGIHLRHHGRRRRQPDRRPFRPVLRAPESMGRRRDRVRATDRSRARGPAQRAAARVIR